MRAVPVSRAVGRLVVLVAMAALVSAACSGPEEESLDRATFVDPSTTVAPVAVVTGAEVTQPASDAWTPVMPEEGVAVATSHPGATEIAVSTAPEDDAPIAWNLGVPTEFGSPRHFQVISELEDWVEVRVPIRPNGSTGWLPKDSVSFTETTIRVEIDVSDRTIQVFDGDEELFATVGAVGQDAYPTPVGEWFVRDIIPWDDGSVYGPWVLALDAYSEQIEEINGGQAVVALHGTNRPDQLGSAVSLGCVRLDNEDVTTVASLVPVGSPVIIVA